MKKSILIYGVVLTVLIVAAYSFMNGNNAEKDSLEALVSENIVSVPPINEKKEFKVFEDFIYDVGSRFGPITKEEIAKKTTINDFIPEDQIQQIESLTSVSVIKFENDKRSEFQVKGISFELNEAQLKYLQSFDYSTNFVIYAEYQIRNYATGELEDSQSTPHLSLVPHQQASYLFGDDALKYYLKENSKEARVGVDPEKLKPAKLFFTVTKEGTIENIHLDRSSNYPRVDKKMIELISTAPGKWMPAENTKGEKVDQELVVSFGLMGC